MSTETLLSVELCHDLQVAKLCKQDADIFSRKAFRKASHKDSFKGGRRIVLFRGFGFHFWSGNRSGHRAFKGQLAVTGFRIAALPSAGDGAATWCGIATTGSAVDFCQSSVLFALQV